MQVKSNRGRISLFLIKAVVVLLPFTAFFALFPKLNPYGQQLSFYPLICIFAFLIISLLWSNPVPRTTFKIIKPLFYVLFISLISFFINLESIETARLQNRSGFGQFISNYSQLIFGISIVIVFLFVLKRNVVSNFEKAIVAAINITLVLLSVYCFFEFLSYQGFKISLFDSIATFLHSEKQVGDDTVDNTYNYGRIKGFSQEPSHLGIIFSIYFPFFLHFNKGKNWYKTLFFLFVMFFTYSKTLFLIFIIETILYFLLVKNIFLSRNGLRWFFLLIPLLSLLALTPIVNKFFSDNSALARTFSQFAAVSSWTDSKKYVWGEGTGQQGFYTIKGFNQLGDINPEYASVITGRRWPYIQNIHIKILVETGIIGLLAWLYVFLYLIISINKVLKNKYKELLIADEYGQATVVSVIGIFFAGFSYENFSFLFTWVAFGIAFGYLVSNKRYLY